MLGPYRVDGVLGQGGMGVVYLGVDAGGRQAAIKTIGQLRSHALMIAFRAEVHALRRVQHPGVVAFMEEGLADAVPWYAMDLIKGPTLGEFNRGLEPARAGTPPSVTYSTLDAVPGGSSAPLETGERAAPTQPKAPSRQALPNDLLLQVLTIYRHVCAALGHVHRRGLIHRDLKPSNILVAARGRPVLVDFGLVSRAGLIAGRETMDSDSSGFLGSPAYMAPEQIRGDSVDARTDLYALGCMLFESLTGRTPFVAASIRDMLDCHLGMLPPSAADLIDGLPEPLLELLSKLLAKAPHDRLGHADDCERALSELGAALSPDYATSERDHAGIYFYRPRPAGRAKVLDKLFAHLERASGRQGSFVLIKGESGSGKTFLVTEVARRSRRARISTVTGECPPIGYREGNEERSSAPLTPIRTLLQLVADRCRAGGRQNTERLLGAHCRILVRYEPTLAHVPGFGEYPEPPETTPAASRERVLAAVRDTLAALSAEAPLVWIIDDLQWADELSLELLASLDRELLGGHALLIAGTCRSEEITPAVESMLGRASPDLGPRGGRRTEAVAIMTAVMLAVDEPPTALVEYLATRGRGNPFFVAEYLRSAANAGVLVRANGRWRVEPTNVWPSADGEKRVDLPVPASIKELISRRNETLPRPARHLLETAPVIVQDQDLENMVSFLRDTESTLESVALLREKQVLGGEGGRLQFVHDQIAELVYSGLSDSRRRELHEEVAQVLERTFDADPAPRHRALAHHWLKAGHPGFAPPPTSTRRPSARTSRGRNRRGGAALQGGCRPGDRGRHQMQPGGSGVGAGGTRRPPHVDGRVPGRGRQLSRGAAPGDRAPRSGAPAPKVRPRAGRRSALRRGRRGPGASRGGARVVRSHGRAVAWWQEWIEAQNELIWVRYWTFKPDGMTALVPLVERVRGPIEAYGTASQRTRLPYMSSLAALSRRDRYRSPEGLEQARACVRPRWPPTICSPPPSRVSSSGSCWRPVTTPRRRNWS